MDSRKIITKNVCPPIPIRRFDWEACRDGWDLDEPIGHGATKEESIEDLLQAEQELYNIKR